ncbi:Fic family protein [uncultured Alistipes sp.]|uniref:Fic family protein n=1 Tax=uncultured Alistipes sp. TaxID=538949 RepID=UPI0025B1A7A2|nr:Fic family protein [uncultured Alistipes sp.]
MKNARLDSILAYLRDNPQSSSKAIFDALPDIGGYATVKRELAKAVAEGTIVVSGQRKAARYSVAPGSSLLQLVDMEAYFSKEIDERNICESYNFELLDTLATVSLFTLQETAKLDALQKTFADHLSRLTTTEYRKEMERLGVDLSWKSSQIEGNTYSLLETERLLLEKETAAGKSKDEAVMLLNHKEALDFILDHPDYLSELTVAKIENIHSILVEELAVDRNIRVRRVGITGTNYRPLDNEFQIREALERTCALVNGKESVFEKALLVLLLLSYIQPFADGNKRTARIVSNALLVANGYCPLSFRTVDSIDYKKAMLLFYEQNNVSAFKRIFVEQFEFAVETYF